MFNNQSVGRRVISKANGEGVITRWDYDDTSYPVKVLFIEGDGYSDWYTKEGYISTEGEDYDENIVPIPIKQGSPDARRIVAMLAVEYRASKKYYLDNDDQHTGYNDACCKMYYDAKDLLTTVESNERI